MGLFLIITISVCFLLMIVCAIIDGKKRNDAYDKASAEFLEEVEKDIRPY